MLWRADARPRKSWMSCAAFWMSTRGEADEQLRELDFTGDFADAGMDVIALPVARRGAGGFVCRGLRGLPERGGAPFAVGGGASFVRGVPPPYLLLGSAPKESGPLHVRGA